MEKGINLNLVHMPCCFYKELREIENCLIRDSIIHRTLASFFTVINNDEKCFIALLVGGWCSNGRAYKHRKIIISHLFLLFHHFLFYYIFSFIPNIRVHTVGMSSPLLLLLAPRSFGSLQCLINLVRILT